MPLTPHAERKIRPGFIWGVILIFFGIVSPLIHLQMKTKQALSPVKHASENEKHSYVSVPSDTGSGPAGMRLVERASPRLSASRPNRLSLSSGAGIFMEQAFRNAMENSVNLTRENELRLLAFEFAKSDPEGALNMIHESWKLTIRDRKPVIQFTDAFAKALGARDPEKAAGYLSSLPEPLRVHYASAMVSEWAKSDASTATRWALEMDISLQKNAVLNAIAGAVEQSASPYVIAQWAETLSKSPNAVDHASALARIWPISDADAALNWLNSLPDQDRRAAAFQEMAAALTQRNYLEAAHWIEQFPEQNSIRDRAVDMVGYTWSKSDFNAAKLWTESMGRVLDEGDHSEFYFPAGSKRRLVRGTD